MLKEKTLKIFRTAIVSVIMTVAFAFAAFAADGLEVHFIDVGQADAALVKCGGHNMLVDGGNTADSQLIYTYLKKQGVTSLDYIVNSHGDEDHVGGIPGAIQLVGSNIGTVFAPYKDLDKDRFQVFRSKLKSVGKDITVPNAGDTYRLGDAKIEILSAGGKGDNESIVLRLKYGDTSFLFTGDADEDQEKEIVNAGYEIESDVLKVGHHGSRTSTCYQFLRAVYPRAAVICVGADNSYGHPTDEVLSKLRDEGAAVFRTDNNGHIVFHSDGHDIQYSVQKESSQEKNLVPGGSSSGHKSSGSSGQTADTAAVSAQTSGGSGAQSYVLNTNTKKFHYPGCASVGKMKAKNREDVVDTRENIIARGYVPCKNCNP